VILPNYNGYEMVSTRHGSIALTRVKNSLSEGSRFGDEYHRLKPPEALTQTPDEILDDGRRRNRKACLLGLNRLPFPPEHYVFEPSEHLDRKSGPRYSTFRNPGRRTLS
jgi:hypothetical protein